jgi:hypothetical protein
MQIQPAEVILYPFEIVVGGDGRLQPFWQPRVGSFAAGGAYLDGLELVAFVYGEQFFGWVLEEVGEGGAGVEAVAEGCRWSGLRRGGGGWWEVIDCGGEAAFLGDYGGASFEESGG